MENTWNFLKKFANVIRQNTNAVNVGNQMNPVVVKISVPFLARKQSREPTSYLLRRRTVGTNDMDFVFPSQDDRVITAPFHRSWWGLCLCIIFAQFILKVATDDPDLAVLRVERNELAVFRDADVLERASLQHPIFRFGYVNDIDSLPDREQDLDRK